MSQSIFPGPIAAENNPPINPQYYQPSRFVISAVTIGATTTITTSVDHNYVVGQNVRVLIPFPYGCTKISGQQGYVLSIPSATQVVVSINSIGSQPFVSSPLNATTPPQIIAIGDINSGPINIGRTGNQTYIDGSFIDISPA